jgi:hypothetical protein
LHHMRIMMLTRLRFQRPFTGIAKSGASQC